MKLLHIIASPRGAQSRTLQIAQEFLNTLRAKDPQLAINELNLFEEKLPDVYGGAVDAKYKLMGGESLDDSQQALQNEIARYANEFLAYDAYLISSPMWNFGIPYKLKHYIDVIMQAEILFRFTADGPVGLALDKKMYCITSRGSDFSERSPMRPLDFQEPYLRAIFGLAGIYDLSFVNAQPMDFLPELTALCLNQAKEAARAMALKSPAEFSEFMSAADSQPT